MSQSQELSPAQREQHIDMLILEMLLDKDAQRPWRIEEIERELDIPEEAPDSIGRLARAGLVHRLDGFVFASRTAIRAHALQHC
jgi:hypothetical protein